MAPKKRRLSSLIESQLPGFIQYEYENFGKFVEKYYEQQESAGQPLDVISNLSSYRDINFYEKNLLNQQSTLVSSITADANTFELENGSSFPEQDGYVQIGDEILFYQSRSGNVFSEVSRGVSGNTTLGDLYTKSTFVTTAAAAHYQGNVVRNISNLFLYALVKEFEKTYLAEFPEAYLKEDVDRRSLIKNITSFYKTKGTDKSIKFIFNSIVSKDSNDVPEVIKPKDYTLKTSVSDWTKNYSLKVKVNSGDVFSLIGQRITQEIDGYDRGIEFAQAVVDNVISIGSDGQEDLYEVILEPSTVNGTFQVSGRSTTTVLLSSTATTDDRITVKSTMGFPKTGKILVGDEIITYKDKTVNQFIIDQRIGPIRNHNSGKTVYRYSTITGNGVKLTTLGILYNILPSHSAPYSVTGDAVQVGDAGFETNDPIIFDIANDRNRWLINEDPASNTSRIKNTLKPWVSDIGAVFEDDQYYYICSSSYPSSDILIDTTYGVNLLDQKHLKLIRKQPVTTTEVYETSNRDVGIFINGVPAVGYKSEEFVKSGAIESIEVNTRGFSYVNPPFVLVNEMPNKARCTLNGGVVGDIEVLTTENFDDDPTIRLTSGEGAILEPVITAGAITSMNIVNAGKYYSSPPVIRIVDQLGKGNFAEFEAILDANGSISEVKKISVGRFYTRGYTTVVVEAVGKNATATAKIKRWVFNRYYQVKNNLDSSNGTVLANYNPLRDYGYAYIANPVEARKRAYTTVSDYNANVANGSLHSPIIGYAYDGNPIYGPYGFTDPYDAGSGISKLLSGYVINGTRPDGPDTGKYPLGSFIDDYRWVPSVNSGKTELDQNNGRFCVTPEYPDGTYAYFITVDANEVPQFPYILGVNYYSLPVDSNYNSNISQDDIPLGLKQLRSGLSEMNGSGFAGLLQDVKSGNVTSGYVESSTNNFSPGNNVYLDNTATGGKDAVVTVDQVTGKTVSSIESTQTKATQIKIQENAYLFEGDTLTQETADGTIVATGDLIGDVFNTNEMVVRNVVGSFNLTDPIDSETLVVTLVLDSDANFTAGATMRLTNDDNEDQATGEILESTSRQNSVKIKVTSSDNFFVTSDYYLRSSNLSDSNRVEIVSVTSLSTDLTPFILNENVAIATTTENHNLGKGDKVTVDILPNDATTTTTYYVRKRLYQSAVAIQPQHNSVIVDEGIGSADVLNSGFGYTTDIYNDVELIFRDSSLARNDIGLPGDSGNAKATIDVSNPQGLGSGGVASIIITTKGKGYKKGDILTVADEDLQRSVTEESPQRLILEVDHVGFAYDNTVLKLSNVNNVSQEDFLVIGPEIVKVTGVDTTTDEVTVERGQQGTTAINHYNDAAVSLKDGFYRFDDNFRPFGEDIAKPFLIEYDSVTQDVEVSYDYNANQPQVLSSSSSFFDSSIPQKLVQFRTVEEETFKLEFSSNNVDFNINPVLNIQKYYKYTFDVSHFSMSDTFLDFSSSSNYNIFTEEKEVSGIAPGNAGSFVSIKLGFGPAISTNTYQERRAINFQNYFYFIKVSPNVDTGGSYLRIIDDPLSGLKEVIYNTDTKFVYSINETPAYDGSGDISYITNSRLAIGNVHSVRVVNTGEGYNLVPIVSGVVPTAVNEAAVEAVWDPARQVVTGFTITDQGDNYSKPAIILTDTDGQRYEYVCEQYNGKLSKVEVLNEGIGFTYQPTARIIESDVKIYLESTNIGVPQNVKINNPGRGYNNDDSLLGSYKSPTTFVLRNINGTFSGGEKIRQSGLPNTTAIVARDGFREGSNLLRVVSINGVFDTGSTIESVLGNRTATLYAQVSTEFEPDIRSYVDNFGFYGSDRGKLSNANQRLQDSYFYQDYSYVIRSKTSITEWRDLIKKTTHPAGFQMFGEMVIESQAASPMPVSQPSLNYVTTVELPPVQITSLSTKRLLTLTQYKLEQLKVEEGRGSISIDTFDATETVTYNVSLSPAFDGTFDPSTGNLIGNTEFTLIDKKNGLALQLTKDEQLICSLDGIFQEPGKAFTISGNKITFAEPPLGARVVEGQDVDPVKFYGRAIKFKESTLNDRYFRKIKSIADQFDGVKTDFSLYWEDGTVVKTDVSENLIVGLNGVIQKARTTETEPFGNAYSIIRDSDENVADIIRFTKPPIDNEDLYGPPEELPEILKNYEQCFIYSIGSYERLKINSDLYEYRFGGPYLIQDEVTNSVRKVDDPKYALVFIDGVLQRDTDSYTIVGPNITFTKPLQFSENSAGNRAVQDVNIILMYGRDVAKTLTFYDFEPFAYNNTIFVTFRGTGIGDRMRGQLDQFSGQNFHLKQGNTVIGKVQNVTRKTPDEVVLTIKSPVNVTVDENTPFSICVVEDMYNPVLITGTYTTSATYKVDDEGLRLLEKDVPSWLYGVEGGNAAWGNRNSMFANLLPGDKILIDGESEYREIVRTPDQVYTKSFVAGDYIQNEHYAKVQATNYEGDTEGEGLSVTCNVNAFGAVTTLNVADVEFNQRDLTLYFDEGILLQPTAYEYFTTPEVHFIPVDGNGGGAKAEVIAYGGQILDVVLTEGGSGYTQPPRVVVARRYKRIKELNRKIDTLIRINVQTDIESVFSMIGQTEVRIEGGPFSPQAISSIVSFGGFDPELNTNRDITQIINTLHGEERQVRMTDEKFVTEARVQSPAVLLENVFTLQEDLILTQVIGGVVGFEALATLETITTEEVNKIIQIRANKAFEPKGIPTSGGLGTFVDAPVSDTSTIIYAANTQGFPDTPARILIGGEYIYYRRKEDDRFLDVVRGYQGTTAIAHNPGDLILSQPEFTVLLSGGVNTILSEGSVAQSSVTSIQKTVEIQPIIEPIDTFTDINEIKQSIDLENEVILERVDKQITIIPPTSYNIVTETHATHSRVFKASAGLSDVFGVNGEVLTAGPEVTEIQLTQAQQIEVDNTSTVSSVTIGSVAATATSTSKVVTTSYESTVVTNTVAFDVLSTLTAVSTQVVENPQTRIDSVSSNIVTFTNLNLNRVALREVQTVQQPFVMHRTSDVVTSVQDIDTEFTTISMVLGGVNATASGGTEIDYRYAIVDFIIEEYVLEEYIFQRNGNQVFLLDPYNEVIRRDGSSFIVENRSQNSPPGFEDYNLGNVGLTLGAFETNAKVDSGIASGLTIADVDAIYPTLNIRDFDFRAESALLGNGDRFNLGIPTYQQPMSEVVSGIDINGEMTLDSNEYFPTSGHIIIRNNSGLYIDTLSVISYTGKSGTDTLTGCQLERGDSSPTGGDLATPFSIV
jgi:hypothetical protein